MNTREQKIIEYFFKRGMASSAEIFSDLVAQGESLTLLTVKRALAHLTAAGVLSVHGKGRATAYTLTEYGKLTSNIDAHAYCSVEPDLRFGADKYNFDLFLALDFNPFSKVELLNNYH